MSVINTGVATSASSERVDAPHARGTRALAERAGLVEQDGRGPDERGFHGRGFHGRGLNGRGVGGVDLGGATWAGSTWAGSS